MFKCPTGRRRCFFYSFPLLAPFFVQCWIMFDYFPQRPNTLKTVAEKVLLGRGSNFINNLSQISDFPMPPQVQGDAIFTIFHYFRCFWTTLDNFDHFLSPKP